jgi:hypothetical protein
MCVWTLTLYREWTLACRHRKLFCRSGCDIFDFLSAFLPSCRELCQETDEPDATTPRVQREIRATVEGTAIRGEKYRHRPPAMPRHPLHGCHIDFINVGAFLPVDFDCDVPIVEQLGDLLIFKGLMLHDMTPVAGCVTNGQENRDIQLLRKGQRFFAPWPPINRVVGMLPQIRRLFVDEAIFELWVLAVG